MTIFTHMTRDVSVFVKCVTIFRLLFFRNYHISYTSNFRKVVRQHTEGMVGKYYMGFAGNLLGFPAVKEF